MRQPLVLFGFNALAELEKFTDTLADMTLLQRLIYLRVIKPEAAAASALMLIKAVHIHVCHELANVLAVKVLSGVSLPTELFVILVMQHIPELLSILTLK